MLALPLTPLPLPMLLPVPLLVLPLPVLPVPLLLPLPMLLPAPPLVLPLPMLPVLPLPVLPVPLLVLPLPMLLPELPLVLPLADGSEDPVEVLPLSPPEVVPAPVPGEPALPLMRPVAFGTRLASLLVPGDVIVEPPLVAPPLTPDPEPGEALGLEDTLACACWLQASKSACVCAATCAGAQTRAAMPRSAVARVNVAMKPSS